MQAVVLVLQWNMLQDVKQKVTKVGKDIGYQGKPRKIARQESEKRRKIPTAIFQSQIRHAESSQQRPNHSSCSAAYHRPNGSPPACSGKKFAAKAGPCQQRHIPLLPFPGSGSRQVRNAAAKAQNPAKAAADWCWQSFVLTTLLN
tara:strand:+ start:1230 stop:1664 length:435 start_codon:yes stop_codon:yes gene_type:complete